MAVTIDLVNYYPVNNYYVVGDNDTFQSDGISNKSFSGEITIQYKVKGKKVKEISKFAFNECVNLKKVTIHAKLISINDDAFNSCTNLEYINIPETVTYIGKAALCLSKTEYDYNSDTYIFVEFNQGRKRGLYIELNGLSRRINFTILYPSDIEPTYFANNQFVGTTSATICAKKEFNFCGKFTTTTDFSKCPPPKYKPLENYYISIAKYKAIAFKMIVHSAIAVMNEDQEASKNKIVNLIRRLINKMMQKKK